jgi:hypothetical protein
MAVGRIAQLALHRGKSRGFFGILATTQKLAIPHIYCWLSDSGNTMSLDIVADEVLPEFPRNIVAWQIDRRWRIQRIMHALHTFLAAEETLHREHNDAWYPVVRMVGISFSLWRAAFLTHATGSKKTTYKNMVEYLDKVVRHNSIAFTDDYNMSDHAAPYYTANARYRLERMYKFNEDLLQISSVAAIHQLLVTNEEEMSQDKLWDLCYAALRDCYLAYMDMWSREYRPQSSSKNDAPAKGKTTRGAGSNKPRQRHRS